MTDPGAMPWVDDVVSEGMDNSVDSPLSASQVKTYRQCPRKWRWDRLSTERAPAGPGARVGHRCHDITEAWLRDGIPPDQDEVITYPDRSGETVTRYPGRIVVAGMHLFPPRGPGLHVEDEVTWSTPASRWVGRMDSWYVADEATVRCDDLKTATDMKWSLKPADLVEDPQALLYVQALHLLTGKPFVDLHWNYIQTTPKAGRHPAKKVRLTVIARAPETVDRLKGIERSARNMQTIKARAVSPLDLPPVVSECSAYGGCPYEAQCQLTPLQVMEGLMNERQEVKIDERVEAALAGLMPSAVAPPPPPLPTAPPPAPPLPIPAAPPLPVPLAPTTDPVNPPEAPPDSMDPVPVMGVSADFDPLTADRKALKAWSMSKGLVESSCNWGIDRLRDLVLEDLGIKHRETGPEQIDDTPPNMLIPSVATLTVKIDATEWAETVRDARWNRAALETILDAYKPETGAALRARIEERLKK